MATHSEKCNVNESCIKPIQVGKAKNKVDIEEISDDTGDNISIKNDSYCELTALYWIWKNTDYEYIGLCHYRRKFYIDKLNVLEELNNNKLIISQPKYLRISVKKQFIREHLESDWNNMIKVLVDKYPEYYNTAKNVFNSNKLYPYNMFIGTKEFVDDYCKWLFSILFELENICSNTKRDKYQKRYIGFLAERLFTLYIIHNRIEINETKVLFNKNKNDYSKVINIVNNCLFKLKYRIGRSI